MDESAVRREVERITWYHELDFGNGLVTKTSHKQIDLHRALWRFIEAELDKIDFSGKSVLDIGCWDGYWSFYAERRGASSVLAVDDLTQNWAGRNSGIHLAKKLLGSTVDVKLDLSIYDLQELKKTFDVILCLGVYYHLVDPIYAFAQVRHCCHRDSIVVFEGDASLALPPDLLYYDLSDVNRSCFVPSPEGLDHLLKASYFATQSQERWSPPPAGKTGTWRDRLELFRRVRELRSRQMPTELVRLLTVCKPFEDRNPLHHYRPPFGLHRYDARFSADNATSRSGA